MSLNENAINALLSLYHFIFHSLASCNDFRLIVFLLHLLIHHTLGKEMIFRDHVLDLLSFLLYQLLALSLVSQVVARADGRFRLLSWHASRLLVSLLDHAV